MGQRQIIVLRLFDEMQNLFQLIANLDSLTTEALGQQHRELGGIDGKNTANDGSVNTLRPRGDQGMPLLSQGAGNQFDQMNRNHRNVPAAENGDSPLALVLQKGQFLSKCVHPVQCREIK